MSPNEFLTREAADDALVFTATTKAQNLALQLYTAGVGNYLDVVVAQVSAFQAATGQLGICIRRQQASVNLVRALGAGWATRDLPPERKIRLFNPLALR